MKQCSPQPWIAFLPTCTTCIPDKMRAFPVWITRFFNGFLATHLKRVGYEIDRVQRSKESCIALAKNRLKAVIKRYR